MQHGTYLSGQLNLALSTLISPHEKRSNLKTLLILLPNGQKSNNLRQMPSSTIRRCTLMGSLKLSGAGAGVLFIYLDEQLKYVL
jgi:hypothetical protein